MLTALGMWRMTESLAGAGADDYVVKPFSPKKELEARIRSVLRRWTKRALLAFQFWRHPCDESEN